MTFETKFRNFVGRIDNLTKEEITIISRVLLEEFNKERNVTIDSWKGKSSFNYTEVGDKIIVTKFQRPEKGEEPKEVKIEIEQKELKDVSQAINVIRKYYPDNKIKSTKVAEYLYGLSWKEIFSNRKIHNKFTIMLNVLDKKGLIEYRGGKIYLK